MFGAFAAGGKGQIDAYGDQNEQDSLDRCDPIAAVLNGLEKLGAGQIPARRDQEDHSSHRCHAGGEDGDKAGDKGGAEDREQHAEEDLKAVGPQIPGGMLQIGIQGGEVGVGGLVGQRDLPEEHVQDQNTRRSPDIDGLMAEGGHIAQAEKGPWDNIGEGGHKLHRAHPRQLPAGGKVGEQNPQKGGPGGRHGGIEQAVAKGAPLRAGQVAPVFQRKRKRAAGSVGEGGEQDHTVFQRHHREEERGGAPGQEGNGTGGV